MLVGRCQSSTTFLLSQRVAPRAVHAVTVHTGLDVASQALQEGLAGRQLLCREAGAGKDLVRLLEQLSDHLQVTPQEKTA